MNSLYQQLSQTGNHSLPNNNFKNIMNLLKGSNNPQQMLMNMAQSNPQLKSVLQLIQNSNMSPKDLFYAMAKQKGVNPEDILKQLK